MKQVRSHILGFELKTATVAYSLLRQSKQSQLGIGICMTSSFACAYVKLTRLTTENFVGGFESGRHFDLLQLAKGSTKLQQIKRCRLFTVKTKQ